MTYTLNIYQLTKFEIKHKKQEYDLLSGSGVKGIPTHLHTRIPIDNRKPAAKIKLHAPIFPINGDFLEMFKLHYFVGADITTQNNDLYSRYIFAHEKDKSISDDLVSYRIDNGITVLMKPLSEQVKVYTLDNLPEVSFEEFVSFEKLISSE